MDIQAFSNQAFRHSGSPCLQVVKGEYSIPDTVATSADARALLAGMLNPQASLRLTVPDIMQHPWCVGAALCTGR